MINLKRPISALFIISALSSGCALFKDRRPASVSGTILSPLFNAIDETNKTALMDPVLCKKNYQDLYQKLFNIAGVDSYFENADLKTMDEDIQTSFETRLALKDTFRDFEGKSSSEMECFSSAQDVFKALRYIEDYIIEVRMDKSNTAPAEYINLKGEFPYLLVNPKFASDFKTYEDLKSGDVILSRGGAYSSAAIARIAKSDYQFSHLSFVYKDRESQELFTSEAHIEIGSVVAPIDAHINEKNARTVVFRHHDEELAHKASSAVYERIKKNMEAGKNVEYDFSMNYKDDSRLFCSEVISSGFKLADPNNDYLPKFKSRFPKGIMPFLNMIGIPVNAETIASTDVFAPGDIQFDPHFDLVAEWRNPKKMEESRYKDFILTKLFEKMETEGYQIDPTIKMDVQGRSLWLLRRTPLVKKFLEKKFPLNMSPAQLEVFMALDKIGDVFYKYIELRSLEFDHPMTPKEIYQVIDEFIKKDLDLYKKFKKGQNVEKPLFHKLFHP